eukprot:6174309-Pleurochrysis_carterae.AAC.1
MAPSRPFSTSASTARTSRSTPTAMRRSASLACTVSRFLKTAASSTPGRRLTSTLRSSRCREGWRRRVRRLRTRGYPLPHGSAA